MDPTESSMMREGLSAVRNQLNARESTLFPYLRQLVVRYGALNLIRTSERQLRVPLQSVYVPVNTNFSVSLEYHGGEITRAWKDPTPGSPSEFVRSEDLPPIVELPLAGAAASRLVTRISGAIDSGVDANYAAPAERPLLLAPPWIDGVKPRFWPIRPGEAVGLDRLTVIVGPPGSGKSTFVRHLAMALVAQYLPAELPGLDDSELAIWPEKRLLPVFVELRQLFLESPFSDPGQKVSEGMLWAYIRSRLEKSLLGDAAPAIRDHLLSGRAVLILDGLDEIPTPSGATRDLARRRQLLDFATEISTIYSGSRIVLTSRPSSYNDWLLPGFSTVHLQPLQQVQARDLALRISAQLRMGGPRGEDVEKLLDAIDEVPSALKDYPLFLTLMAALYWNKGQRAIPTDRASLYAQSVDLLLNRWAHDESGEDSLTAMLGCTTNDLRERLKFVAFRTHRNAPSRNRPETEIDFAVLAEQVLFMDDDVNVQRVLAYLTQQSGVIVSREKMSFEFAHRGFQEYLAATYLLDRLQDGSREGGELGDELIGELLEEAPVQWREPLLLLGDLIVRGPRPAQIWPLIYFLVGDCVNCYDPPVTWRLWLASRYLRDQALVPELLRKHSVLANDLRAGLATLLERNRDMAPPERADCAVVLGLIGDPRAGVGVRDSVPDVDWRFVAGATFVLGTSAEVQARLGESDWARDWEYSREAPETEVTTRGFFMSRFPVTVSQFRAFVEASDGYDRESWWGDAGLKWRTRVAGRLSSSTGAQLDNLPQTSVSWFEATAYCRWLAARTGLPIRLPTENEWELAARGAEGRTFPWGDSFDPALCNSNVSGLQGVVPVGTLSPDAASSAGIADLSGNVWEWCASLATDPEGEVTLPYDATLDGSRETSEAPETQYRVVRGGSFMNPPFLMRGAYRGRDLPGRRLARSGFRVVASDVHLDRHGEPRLSPRD